MRSSSLKGISIKNFFPNSLYLSKIFFQSAPISAALFMISIGNLIILWYISIFGEFATAGYGSATRFEQILLLPVLGLNTAIISIVAQNLGAKKFLRVKQSYFYAIFYGFTMYKYRIPFIKSHLSVDDDHFFVCDAVVCQ